MAKLFFVTIVLQVNFNMYMYNNKWTLNLAYVPWQLHNVKVPQVHSGPKLGHNKINGCEVIWHKSHVGKPDQMTFDRSSKP